MTLLVLDLKVPTGDNIHTEIDLWRGLIELLPRVLTFLMSCLTLGIFWLGQQTQLNFLARGNRDLARLRWEPRYVGSHDFPSIAPSRCRATFTSGPVIAVVTSAISTIIVNRRGDRTPSS